MSGSDVHRRGHIWCGNHRLRPVDIVLVLAGRAGVLGAADMISMVIRASFVQLETPDEMRGRVSAVNGLFIGWLRINWENSNPA